MAALTLFIFSLLASTAFAIEEDENTQAVEIEERPAFQALPLQFTAEQKEFYFHVYFHEIFQGTPGHTTETAVSPNDGIFPNFGDILICDVPLWDSLDQKTILARAQGSAMQANQNTYGWLLNYNIVFEWEKVKGSTLQVMGRALELTTSREWSIVGGTGIYTMAKGVVYGRRLSSPEQGHLWIELKIHGYYTPMQMPPWNSPPPAATVSL